MRVFANLALMIPFLPLCAAGMDMDMSMENTDVSSATQNASEIIPVPHEVMHEHGTPILETKLTPAEYAYWSTYNTTTYFTVDAPHKSALWYHVFTLFVCVFITYPIGLVLNNVKSKWYIPALTVHALLLLSSLISLRVFGSNAPDLYPKNAYSKMSYILFVATIIHYFVAVFFCASKWISGEWITPDILESQSFIPLDDIDIERGEGARSPSPTPSTLIDSESNSRSHSQEHQEAYRDDSLDLGDEYFKPHPAKYQSQSSSTRDGILSSVFNNPTVKMISGKFRSIINVLFKLMNLPMLFYLGIYSVTGIATGNLLGQGSHVFNLLAHFIKGGVFVSLGLFSLARYCGVLSKQGLAWNKCVMFKNEVDHTSFWYRWTPHGMFTMEFYESFLIFFYGSTNIFLEHLAAEPGVWDAKDLQHVSIAFMYIGAGLCGLITEKILSDWRFNQVMSNTKINSNAIHAGSPGYSPNPFPVFTIFWTGILMSQHKQASETSTVIHEQWGYLLSYGSFFRLLTFILLMLVPNKNLNPARPFTELITSFCLIAGGGIFMQSTDQVVEALEYRGLTSMFTLNVNVGCVALIMAWEMVLLISMESMKRK